jgi:hypothetical protein
LKINCSPQNIDWVSSTSFEGIYTNTNLWLDIIIITNNINTAAVGARGLTYDETGS